MRPPAFADVARFKQFDHVRTSAHQLWASGAAWRGRRVMAAGAAGSIMRITASDKQQHAHYLGVEDRDARNRVSFATRHRDVAQDLGRWAVEMRRRSPPRQCCPCRRTPPQEHPRRPTIHSLYRRSLRKEPNSPPATPPKAARAMAASGAEGCALMTARAASSSSRISRPGRVSPRARPAAADEDDRAGHAGDNPVGSTAMDLDVADGDVAGCNPSRNRFNESRQAMPCGPLVILTGS